MNDLLQLRDVLARAARQAPWSSDGSVTFIPSDVGRAILDRAVVKQRGLGRQNYGLADAARDILDWAAQVEGAMRKTPR